MIPNVPGSLDQDQVFHFANVLEMTRDPFLICSRNDECLDQSQNNFGPAIVKRWLKNSEMLLYGLQEISKYPSQTKLITEA